MLILSVATLDLGSSTDRLFIELTAHVSQCEASASLEPVEENYGLDQGGGGGAYSNNARRSKVPFSFEV